MYQLVAIVCSVNVLNFYNSERIDMIMLYGEVDGNARLARGLWIERFPNRAIPCARIFTSVVQHFRDHDTFKLQTYDRGRHRSERILQVEGKILECVEARHQDSPTCS